MGHGRGSIWTRSLHSPAAPADDALRSSRHGEGYKKLHNFRVCTGTPFYDFSREFRVLVSAVMGSERVGGGLDGGERAVSHLDA